MRCLVEANHMMLFGDLYDRFNEPLFIRRLHNLNQHSFQIFLLPSGYEQPVGQEARLERVDLVLAEHIKMLEVTIRLRNNDIF